MRKLAIDNLHDLAIGSAILGSGGGGDPTYSFMMAKYEMEKNGPVSLINVSDLKPQDLVLPVGFMGAPLAEMEKIPSGREFFALFKSLEKSIGRKVDAVMPFEIGGGNAFTPISVAAQMGLPVVDADTMGRAYPVALMSSCHLFNISPSPGFVADGLGNTVVIYARNTREMEKIARQVTVSMGSTNAFGFFPLLGKQVKTCTISKSISKAISIGKAHREARKKGNDPLESILNLCKGIHIGTGKIIDIEREISDGILKGNVVIQNGEENRLEIDFQNDYFIAKCNGKIVAITPDILMLLEQETGAPITCEALQFGLRVNLIGLPAPEIWTTPAGLACVGPRLFGYSVDYQPINKKLIRQD